METLPFIQGEISKSPRRCLFFTQLAPPGSAPQAPRWAAWQAACWDYFSFVHHF